MKKFYAPEINIEMYDVEDIITASGVTTPTLNTKTGSDISTVLNGTDEASVMVGVEW